MNSLQKLKLLGQSVWLDDINREMIENGELIELIERDGVSGITSNPAIFEKAITDSTAYDDAIAALKKSNVPPIAIYETLALEDVRKAADLFYPVFERSKGRDGFVSLEVSPYLANDTEQSIKEGRRLWKELDRVNTLIKIPATEAGLPVIEQLIAEGINVNVTLIFSVSRYRQVVEAFLRGLETRVQKNKSIDHIISFASFFLSRIDVMIDKLLDEKAAQSGDRVYQDLRGQAAISSARIAYQYYLDWIRHERWQTLSKLNAIPQLLLWASTGTKDDSYSDIKYIEALVAKDTVTTVPRETLEAYRDHGDPIIRNDQELRQANQLPGELKKIGIDLDEVAKRLEAEGIEKFIKPFDKLLQSLDNWSK
ncbi:MAG: transaldolase [Nitrosomonas sp.]